jgi:hypothetical protein
MAKPVVLDESAIDSMMAKMRLHKAVETYYKATPFPVRYRDVRIFRASRMHNFCAVEMAYVVRLVKKKAKKKVIEWAQSIQLPPHLTEIIDTGTVVHKQLQYYAGLVGFVTEGQWVCPSCGLLTHKNVPMPMVDRSDPVGGLDFEYPGPCPKCRGRNFQNFPPWLYVEPTLQEKIKGVPKKLRVTGHTDGIWTFKVKVGKKVVRVRVLVDYKTINRAGFEGAYGGGLPREEHVTQLQVYLALADLEYGLLLYYCKDNSQHKRFLVKRDPKLWPALQKKVNWARKGKVTKAAKVKHRLCNRLGHPRSRECLFVEECWGAKPKENWVA